MQLFSVDFHHVGSLQRAANNLAVLEWRAEIHIEHHQCLALPQPLDRAPRSRVPLRQGTKHDSKGFLRAGEQHVVRLDRVPRHFVPDDIRRLAGIVDRRFDEPGAQDGINLHQIRCDAVASRAPNGFPSETIGSDPTHHGRRNSSRP